MGTFCTIDNSNVVTVLKIKNFSGGSVVDLSLSSNIINDVLCVEYTGPINVNGLSDGMTFFTVERVNSTTCMVKRWEVNVKTLMLDLKHQYIKKSSGDYYYDAVAATVEVYRRTIDAHNPGNVNYIDMDLTDKIEFGINMFLGPSTDADNVGATESATVSYVGEYIGGQRVYFTKPLKYQYVKDDPVSFYNNVYVFSKIGVGGSDRSGTVFKLDANNGNMISAQTSSVYTNIHAARWCEVYEAIGITSTHNLMFIKPYESYINWKSLSLNNVADDLMETLSVEDVVFNDYNVYKLTNGITQVDDDGNRLTTKWNNNANIYNYVEDTLLPYTNSVMINCNESSLFGYNKVTYLYIRVSDQYGVALKNVDIRVYVDSGDTGGLLDPLSGILVTDINGTASLSYTSGASYSGHTVITCKAVGGSPYSGSDLVWGKTSIINELEFSPLYLSLYQIKDVDIDCYPVRQIKDGIEDVPLSLHCKNFFSTPGGDWSEGNSIDMSTWLPDIVYDGDTGPKMPFQGPEFIEEGVEPSFEDMPNRISQVLDFDSKMNTTAVTTFKVINEDDNPKYAEPYTRVLCQDERGDLQVSQLHQSTHKSDSLNVYDDIDQFVFVEDAIPKFWSYKNPIRSNIWLRLRPFAFNLDPSTLEFYVKEVHEGKTDGYHNVTEYLQINTFDAGPSLVGLEILYDPEDFNYDSVVHVKILVYDEAPEPNLIQLRYWFKIIPDYNRPYIENIYPIMDAVDVPVNTEISFDIKDEGYGVDISTLEMTVDYRIVTPVITKVNDNHYQVSYTSDQAYLFGKETIVGVMVGDMSVNQNKLIDSFRFTTENSLPVVFENTTKNKNKRGELLDKDISYVVLDSGSGVDAASIVFKVYGKDVTDMISTHPVLYRLS